MSEMSSSNCCYASTVYNEHMNDDLVRIWGIYLLYIEGVSEAAALFDIYTHCFYIFERRRRY